MSSTRNPWYRRGIISTLEQGFIEEKVASLDEADNIQGIRSLSDAP